MPNTVVLDVLIVYNGATASSASDSSSAMPFLPSSQNLPCNDAYAYMLQNCQRHHLQAGFTTSADIIGPGKCSSYWTYTKSSWHKILRSASSKQIFDKFSPKNLKDKAIRKRLFSDQSIAPYNSPAIFEMFFDKQNTYDSHPSCTIPTLSLELSTLDHIISQCDKLQVLSSLSDSLDYTREIIMKDRYGAGGWHVYKIKSGHYKQMLSIMQKYPGINFVIQPFTLFNAKDIRLIYIDGQLLQSYYRQAKSGDFRCNEHQGGTSTYISLSSIPSNIQTKADLIISSLPHGHSLIALDFIVGDSGRIHFIEGNTGPGISWDKSNAKEVFMGKQLIRHIVKDLISKINSIKPRLHHPKPTLPVHISPAPLTVFE